MASKGYKISHKPNIIIINPLLYHQAHTTSPCLLRTYIWNGNICQVWAFTISLSFSGWWFSPSIPICHIWIWLGGWWGWWSNSRRIEQFGRRGVSQKEEQKGYSNIPATFLPNWCFPDNVSQTNILARPTQSILSPTNLVSSFPVINT